MTTMKEIDTGLKQTEVTARKNYLIRQLNKLEITHTSDGRSLNDVSLYTLEWTYISVKCDVGRAFGER